MNRRHLLTSIASASCCLATTGGTARAEIEETAEPRHRIDKQVEALLEKSTSTASMLEAYGKGVELWDAELNRVYKELAGLLHEEGKTALKNAQRAWVAFRDAEKALVAQCYSQYEGTVYLPMEADAVMQITRQRAMGLAKRLGMHHEHAAKS